jgi:steroid 5-alpha reductase family enzyme
MQIKQKYPIDFAKSITWLVVIGLIYYFNQFNNLTAWIYFCLHGSYGIMWVMKSNIFPDKTWEKKAGIPYTILIIFGLMIYWAPAFIITMSSHEASLEIIVGAIILFSFGIFYHFVSDMQKYIYLKYNSGLITDGLWKQCRHPNYFGELLIYSSFLLLTIESSLWLLPVLILGIFICIIWVPGMKRIDRSLSRFDGHEAYKKKTAFIIPYTL